MKQLNWIELTIIFSYQECYKEQNLNQKETFLTPCVKIFVWISFLPPKTTLFGWHILLLRDLTSVHLYYF